MKKISLLTIAICLCTALIAQQLAFKPILNHSQIPEAVVKYPGYTSYWNPSTLIPDSVIWVATPHQKNANRSSGFHATGGRPNLTRDYKGSKHDIGHNCDASDENGNTTDEYNSFDYVNTFPQVPNCNRITWLALETYTRSLNRPVRVKVSWYRTKSHIGADSVTVPLYCIKELTYPGHYEKYVMPNQDTVIRHPFGFYKVKK